MGSKRRWLQRGLGDLVCAEAEKGKRFVDLFTGTGQVSWFVAEQVPVPVIAADLQLYSRVLAGAIIEREAPLDPEELIETWLDPALESLSLDLHYKIAKELTINDVDDITYARKICGALRGGPVWTAYGGHYFSPLQATIFDKLIAGVPRDDRPTRLFCKALLVLVASRCAAAPGHTAQPFQPRTSALPHIVDSWQRDPLAIIKAELPSLALRHALRRGESLVADANQLALELKEGDVVFLDPPYSSVQYSRFYHVLETVARGSCGPVTGVGRYPAIVLRPRSAYSLKMQAWNTMMNLLESLASRGCRVILTFPYCTASNGINGAELTKVATRLFQVSSDVVESRFSTLGGDGRNRKARQATKEIVAVMKPL